MFTLQAPTKRVEYLAFSSDGRKLAAGWRDQGVWVFDLIDRRLEAQLAPAGVQWVGWALGSRWLTLGGSSGMVLWNLKTLDDYSLHVFENFPHGNVRPYPASQVHEKTLTVAFLRGRPGSPSLSCTVVVATWSLETLKVIHTTRREFDCLGMSVAIAGAGSGLVALAGAPRMESWETAPARADPGAARAVIAGAPSLTFWDHTTDAVETVTLPEGIKPATMRFTIDGRNLAMFGDGKGWLFDKTRGVFGCVEASSGISDMAISPDGRVVAGSLLDGRVILWDVRTCREKAVYDWKLAAAFSVTFAPDGMTAAVGGSNGVICLWDVEAAG